MVLSSGIAGDITGSMLQCRSSAVWRGSVHHTKYLCYLSRDKAAGSHLMYRGWLLPEHSRFILAFTLLVICFQSFTVVIVHVQWCSGPDVAVWNRVPGTKVSGQVWGPWPQPGVFTFRGEVMWTMTVPNRAEVRVIWGNTQKLLFILVVSESSRKSESTGKWVLTESNEPVPGCSPSVHKHCRLLWCPQFAYLFCLLQHLPLWWGDECVS